MRSVKWIIVLSMATTLLLGERMALADKGYIKDPDLLLKIQIGITTKQRVLEVLGEPENAGKFARREVESLGYWIDEWGKRFYINIYVNSQDIVVDIERLQVWGP